MDRTDKEEYIVGCILLLSNKLAQFGDCILPDITFKQWFLLLMVSKMQTEEKSIHGIAEFTGTSRQNVKKMLAALETKGYVTVCKSTLDARALKVELTEKTYQYFADHAVVAAEETDKLFADFSLEEIDSLAHKLEKLFNCLALYREKGEYDEQE